MTYELPPLRFGFHELEPYFSAEMVRHHVEIHRGYTDGINSLLRENPALDGQIIERVMLGVPALPEPLRERVRLQAGGHGNHQFLWKIVGPPSTKKAPGGALAEHIERSFGSFDGFASRFRAQAMALSGQGWAFLVLDRWGSDQLEILTLQNNDSVLPLKKPGVMTCDLWDHAREPKYAGDREAYLDAFFNVIDWSVCEARFKGFRDGSMKI
jgi:Fe-Mn family superoxide dismutase